MMRQEITYRQASYNDLKTANEWAAKEGWNPGVHDTGIFYETDPSGFVCAERNGEVIATGSVVAYGKEFGFMGFFIVRPDLRGQGIGRDFWFWRRDLLRNRLHPEAPIGMDGVFDMQPFYAKGGFTFSHRNLRMEGVGKSFPGLAGLAPLDQIPFKEVERYDLKHFGYTRERFLRKWIHPGDGRAFGVIHGENLSGIGVIRPCLNGYKIGPLFADDPETAEKLFRALSTVAEGKAIYLDIPENNPFAVDLANRYDLSEVFGCARMYYGPAPELPWTSIYGITTFELG